MQRNRKPRRRAKLSTASALLIAAELETVETRPPTPRDLALGLVAQHVISRLDEVFEQREKRITRGEISSLYPRRDRQGRPTTTIGVGLDPLRQPLARMSCNAKRAELRGLTELLFGEQRGAAKGAALRQVRVAIQTGLDDRAAGLRVLDVTTGWYPDQRVKTLVVTLHDPNFARNHPEIVDTIPRTPRLRLMPEQTVPHRPEFQTTAEHPQPKWMREQTG